MTIEKINYAYDTPGAVYSKLNEIIDWINGHEKQFQEIVQTVKTLEKEKFSGPIPRPYDLLSSNPPKGWKACRNVPIRGTEG